MNESQSLEEMLSIDYNDPYARAARDLLDAEHDLHKRINKHREQNGISIETVAERMGIPVPDARAIAAGYRDLRFSTLRRYALASDCVVTYNIRSVYDD